jgi:hypothetical protein
MEMTVNSLQDDRIFRSTRIVAAGVVPILVLAFLILYLFPETSGTRFAWEIKPNMTAVFMGAGYLGGASLFVHTVMGQHWHRVAPGFIPVTSFTVAMMVTTVLHWERFDTRHFPFMLWLILYVVTPLLIPFLWWRNRGTDPGTPELNDQVVPSFARWSLRLLGLGLLLFAIIGFLQPEWIVALWPWTLSLLTARILSGWFVLLGVGGLVIGRETRWSSWRVGLQSIGLWHVLVVIGAFFHREDFPHGLVNWYLISVVVVLVSMAVLYGQMEYGRKQGEIDSLHVN